MTTTAEPTVRTWVNRFTLCDHDSITDYEATGDLRVQNGATDYRTHPGGMVAVLLDVEGRRTEVLVDAAADEIEAVSRAIDHLSCIRDELTRMSR